MKEAINLRMDFFSAMAHKAIASHGLTVSEVVILFFDMASDWGELARVLCNSIPEENNFASCVVSFSVLRQILDTMPEVLETIDANLPKGDALLLGLSDEVFICHVKAGLH